MFVFSDGTDTFFHMLVNTGLGTEISASLFTIKVDDKDMVLTTAFGAQNLTTAAFGFSLAQTSGSTGVDITLS